MQRSTNQQITFFLVIRIVDGMQSNHSIGMFLGSGNGTACCFRSVRISRLKQHPFALHNQIAIDRRVGHMCVRMNQMNVVHGMELRSGCLNDMPSISHFDEITTLHKMVCFIRTCLPFHNVHLLASVSNIDSKRKFDQMTAFAVLLATTVLPGIVVVRQCWLPFVFGGQALVG